ncbi:hypothetical protein TWF730_008806 [Orbilia blumenaviensis]|uniref:Uncharacterized protein n=1 Tax=Orbilia blumenaviensis TaxID=1796055 RepID=A0AAV9V6J7_9PEZI
MEPPEFEIMIQWLYDGGYELPDEVYGSDFACIYKTADFLGISGLKQEMVKQFATLLKSERTATEIRRIKSPLTVLLEVTEIAPCSDWELLRHMANEAMVASSFTKDGLFDIATGKLGSPLFAAIMLEAYQTYIRLNTCIRCVFNAKDRPGGFCRVCKKDLSTIPKS